MNDISPSDDDHKRCKEKSLAEEENAAGDIMNSMLVMKEKKPIDDVPNIFHITSPRMKLAVVEDGINGGEILLVDGGSGEDWTEVLKDLKVWEDICGGGVRWQWGSGEVEFMTFGYGHGHDQFGQVLDADDGEVIVWEDDVWNLKEICEIPNVPT